MNPKSNWLKVAAPAFALVLTACGGGDGGGGNTTPALTPATSPAAGAGTQSAGLSSSTVSTLSGLAGGAGAPKYRSPYAEIDNKTSRVNKAGQRVFSVTRQKSSAAIKKAVSAKGTTKAVFPGNGVAQACADGGTYTVTGTYDPGNYSYSISVAYLSCREYNLELNGTVSESGAFTAAAINSQTFDSGTFSASTTGFSVEFFVANTTPAYSVLYGRYTSTLTLSGSYGHSLVTTTHTWTYGVTANGTQSYTDFLDTFSIDLSNFQATTNRTLNDNGTALNYADDTWNNTDTFNGGISESWTDSGSNRSVSLTYTNFVVGWFMPPVANNYWQSTIDGMVGIVFSPEQYCGTSGVSGTYDFDTTTPIRYNVTTGKTEAGRMTINTTTVIVFNANGTVTVTVNGGAPTTYSSLDAMEAICTIQDADADQGTVTDMSTATLPMTGSGTTLIGNLSWTPNEFETAGAGTILDLHVNHYSISNPTGTTVGTWFIDWHNRDVASVLPDNSTTYDGNLPYYSVGNSSGTEATDFDRLAIDGMPAGYYVISVNSFDLGTATSITGKVTLKIGTNTYAFPTNTFTVEDIEGTTPAAWWRVCDLVSDGAGNVTIRAPDLSLQAWHDGNFGLFAPATAKALRLAK